MEEEKRRQLLLDIEIDRFKEMIIERDDLIKVRFDFIDNLAAFHDVSEVHPIKHCSLVVKLIIIILLAL